MDGKESTIDDIMASFGYCICGRPEVFLFYLRNYLELVDEKDGAVTKDVWAPYWYFCDEKGFTEHGGSVLGAWITDRGKEMLKKLNEIEL